MTRRTVALRGIPSSTARTTGDLPLPRGKGLGDGRPTSSAAETPGRASRSPDPTGRCPRPPTRRVRRREAVRRPATPLSAVRAGSEPRPRTAACAPARSRAPPPRADAAQTAAVPRRCRAPHGPGRRSAPRGRADARRAVARAPGRLDAGRERGRAHPAPHARRRWPATTPRAAAAAAPRAHRCGAAVRRESTARALPVARARAQRRPRTATGSFARSGCCSGRAGSYPSSTHGSHARAGGGTR
jgi:hypothetical protein